MHYDGSLFCRGVNAKDLNMLRASDAEGAIVCPCDRASASKNSWHATMQHVMCFHSTINLSKAGGAAAPLK